MFNLLIQCINKKRNEASVMDIETQVKDFISAESKEDIILSSQSEGITLTFNQDDILVKIEMPNHGKCFDEFLNQYCDSTVLADKTLIKEKMGEPTANMKYPPSMGHKEQLMFNKAHYWIVILLNNELLHSVSLVSPILIADNIKNKFVPMRICKSKD